MRAKCIVYLLLREGERGRDGKKKRRREEVIERERWRKGGRGSLRKVIIF